MNKAHAKKVGEKHLGAYMKSDGNTIERLQKTEDVFFDIYDNVEYQVSVGVIDHGDGVLALIVSVDDMTLRSFVHPVTVSDYRAENDAFWTTGTRKIVEDTAERYPYGNLHGEHASHITPACAFHVLKHLEKTLESMHDSVVYAVGYTKKRNREIKHIEDRLPINLIINKSTTTTLYYPLLFLLPSRMVRLFLIKINDKGCLVRLFHELNGHLAIRYSILDKKSEAGFLRAVNNSDFKAFKGEEAISKHMKTFDEYVSYTIRTNEGVLESACFLEYAAYGKNAPKALTGLHLMSEARGER